MLSGMNIDYWVAALLFPLAVWVVINGLDDLVIDIAAACSYWNLNLPSEADLDAVPERQMAIFVALWKEHRVIQKMIENNVTRMEYGRVEFFIGVYPNDSSTVAAVKEASAKYPNVHYAVTPHDGPTSKADNLNWIYQKMLLLEEERGIRFEMVLTHDAEDLIDPHALRWINYYAQWHEMVQIPVLALPTPPLELAHGVYCDEFAEFQFKDMPARQFLGGFIPSNGVGTGFSRKALEALAAAHSNQIFEPACLTEDYENGFRIRRLGMAQKFIPIVLRHGRPIATREFFPRSFSTAIRQRSRWVTGITLQSWEFHGFRESFQHLYWFWRDRKGVVGNLVTPLTNVLFLYGVGTWSWAHATHHDWALAHYASNMEGMCVAGLSLQGLQTAIRTCCSARIYGWKFASAVPVRVLAGNWINFFATWKAVSTYATCKFRGQPLRWAKTEHNYPTKAAMMTERKLLGEVLTGSGWITKDQLAEALARKPAGVRLGEYLVRRGWLSEDDLYAALSLQGNLPLGIPDRRHVTPAVTRSLPSRVARKWKVLPFKIAGGEMFVAGSELPDAAMRGELKKFSSLEIRFHLVTPVEFELLAERYL